MQPITIRITAVRFNWNRQTSTLWVCLTLEDGRRYRVGLPVSYYAEVFCNFLRRLGVQLQPEVGADLASVDGLFGFVKKAAKKAKKATRKAVRATAGRVTRTAQRAVAKTAGRAYKRIVPKKVRRVVSKVTRPVTRTAIYRSGMQPSRVLSGQFAREVRRYGPTAARLAATGASFVPGVGTGVAAGLSGAAAAAEGRSLGQIAKQAAMGAVPGGALGRAAVEAGYGVATGKRVDRALLAGARQAVPGGPAGQAIFDASLAVARGKRPDRAVKQAAVRMAMSQVPPQYRGVAAAGIAAAQGKRVDRALLGAASQIARQQMAGQSQDRLFQAVSGQGLAALASANKTAALADEARRAGIKLARGQATQRDRQAVARAQAVGRRAVQLSRSRNPWAQMAVAAMRQQPGAARAARRYW
jgi:hypothetical protein